MELKDYLSIAAFALSLVSVSFSIGFGLYDRVLNIKARSVFFEADSDEDGPVSPPVLTISIANYGRRDAYLEYLYFQYGTRRPIIYAETVWEGDIHGRYRLGEGSRYQQSFDPDSDGILRNDKGEMATRVFFQDSLGRRYDIKDAGRNIRKYLEVAGDF
ncbi:MAG: hypothetical protein ACOYY3_07270 [Chloroflexota bacterium]